MKRRIICMILLAVFVFSAAACGEKPEDAPPPPETQKDEETAHAARSGQKLKAAGLSSAVNGGGIICVNCKIDGQDSFTPEKDKGYIAQAVLPAGMAVDHWELDGRPVDNQGRKYSLNFKAYDYALVSCVLRPEYTVKSINASMQLLNKKGQPEGLFFTECVFESDYFNAAAGDVYPGGSISVHVRADVPDGMAVDYWKINGVPYFFKYPISEFTVLDLRESTVYEAVLRGEYDEPSSPLSLLPPPGRTERLPGDLPFGVEEYPEDVPEPPEILFPEPPAAPDYDTGYTEPPAGSADPLPVLPFEPVIPDMPDNFFPVNPPPQDPVNTPKPGDAPPNIGTDDRPDYPNNWDPDDIPPNVDPGEDPVPPGEIPGDTPYVPWGPDDPDCPPGYTGPWADGSYG